MLKLIEWLVNHKWDFHYLDGKLLFIVTNYELEVTDDGEAQSVLKDLEANHNYN